MEREGTFPRRIKLGANRVAWAAADNALQIHGGNGFALEYQISRILCDARILTKRCFLSRHSEAASCGAHPGPAVQPNPLRAAGRPDARMPDKQAIFREKGQIAD